MHIRNCCGQRYIGCGQASGRIEVSGTPGNALGAYMDGGAIRVHGNAQDAVGDTMNEGEIWVEGRAGDAAGYAMRGGRLFIRDDVGYRAGVHMKEYGDKRPALVIGGCAGSFLGEYQAGGTILVLGLGCEGRPLVGNFCGRGMYGGRIYLRAGSPPTGLDSRLLCARAGAAELAEIERLVKAFCKGFGRAADPVMQGGFYCVRPDDENPYRQLYAPI